MGAAGPSALLPGAGMNCQLRELAADIFFEPEAIRGAHSTWPSPTCDPRQVLAGLRQVANQSE